MSIINKKKLFIFLLDGVGGRGKWYIEQHMQMENVSSQKGN